MLHITNRCDHRELNTADKYLWLPFKTGFEKIMLLTESIYHSHVSFRPETEFYALSTTVCPRLFTVL